MDVEEGKEEGKSSSLMTLVDGDDDPRTDPLSFICFHILEAVGVGWKGTTVYKAVRSPSADRCPEWNVALMYVDAKDEDVQNTLLSIAWYNEIASGSMSNSMLECDTFLDLGGSHYCIYFPYLENGSLLSFMARRFPRGLPEKLILVYAYHILSALMRVHSGTADEHGQVSAAHVFVLDGDYPWRVKLAFGASVHHLLADRDRDSVSPYLPATSACEWAAAPRRSSYRDVTVMRADDMWSFGITLLEMAYGGLRVKTRDDLDALINRIRNNNKLPTNFNDHHVTSCSFRHPTNRVFSRRFVRMVVRCLDLDPQKRPTAPNLRQHKIFSKTRNITQRHLLWSLKPT